MLGEHQYLYEADIIIETVRHLLNQTIDVHVIDNWSTDNGYNLLLEKFADNIRVTLSRFPEALQKQYDYVKMFDHKVSIGRESGYDWIIHCDADELRSSSRKNVSLGHALGWVDALGYNAIDFTEANFRFCPDTKYIFPKYEKNLLRFEFGRRPGHFLQIKVWKNKNCDDAVLSASGGHECAFSNRRVFPLKFLLKHYPFRNSEQTIKKSNSIVCQGYSYFIKTWFPWPLFST